MKTLGSFLLTQSTVVCLVLMMGSNAAQAKPLQEAKKKTVFTCDQYPREVLLKKAKKYQKTILNASRKHRVSPNLIKAVITVESCFRSRARSRAGAAGLMQLMPATGKRFGAKDRYNTKHNIMAGTKYLRFLLDRFHGNVKLASAAYNAGEGAVDRYNGVPPYRETVAYVDKVLHTYQKLNRGTAKSNNKSKEVAQRSINKLELTLPELNEAYKLTNDERHNPELNLERVM